MIVSATLVEISTAIGETMPVDLESSDSLVKKACRACASRTDVWDKLSPQAQEYMTEAIKAIKKGDTIPIPADFKDGSSKATKKVSSTKELPEWYVKRFPCKSNIKQSSLRSLLEMLEYGQIEVPRFQRKDNAWKPTQTKQFLSGILNGMPIPAITLAIHPGETQRSLIDGLQRLSNFNRFIKGDLSVDGLKFEDIPEQDQQDFLFKDISIEECVTERQYWPDLYRFRNQNNTPLNDMEIRRAVFHDQPILDKIEYVTEKHELWLEIQKSHQRYKGLSMLFRAVAMNYGYQDYSKPMAKFLDRVCAEWVRYPYSIDVDKIYSNIDSILWAIRHKSKFLFKTNTSSQINQGLVDCIFHAGFMILDKAPDVGEEDLATSISWIVSKLTEEGSESMRALTEDTSGVESVISRMKTTETLVLTVIKNLKVKEESK